MSADTMRKGFAYLEPLLIREGEVETEGKIVIATVKGDIHDIGKNIVALMLRNYGFDVVDLGKDVPAEVILHKACEVKADIIALSALMTTTMTE
jgi:5-methyltetrahydrofolate--homocysteine methyltransferase